jgi:hypothetical protein
MKQVTINGVSYLGVLKDTEGTLELSQAMVTNQNGISKADVEAYLGKQNLGTLETITFGGTGASYTVQDLTDEVDMFFKMGKLVMDQSQKVAVKKLQNAEFKANMGKM